MSADTKAILLLAVMDLRSCLLLVFFIVSAQASCGDFQGCIDPSDINCIDCSPYSNYRVRDPFDCHKYLVCHYHYIAFNGASFSCPDGEIFSSSAHQCIAGDSCTEECPKCLYTCINRAGAVADPNDCSVYYECNGDNIGPLHTCPPTEPYFDGFECQADITKCCHCKPYCYQADINHVVVDPRDCRRFYGCTTEGEPTYHGECDHGEFFDGPQEKCSDSTDCTTSCKNVIGSDGCIDPYTCQATGDFAKCPGQCVAEFYRCYSISDNYIDAFSCSDGYVFHPGLLRCVLDDECP